MFCGCVLQERLVYKWISQLIQHLWSMAAYCSWLLCSTIPLRKHHEMKELQPRDCHDMTMSKMSCPSTTYKSNLGMSGPDRFRDVEHFQHCHWHNVESVHSIWSCTHQLNTLNTVTDTMLNPFTPFDYTHMDWTLWMLSLTQSWICLLHFNMHTSIE